MKLSRFLAADESVPMTGVYRDGYLHVGADGINLLELIGQGHEAVRAAAAEALANPRRRVLLDEVTPLPCVDPPSVRDAMCFHEHIRNGFGLTEIDPLHSRFPTFYFSNPAGILGARDDVRLAPGTERFDYELEVAVVIGEPGENLHPDEAERHIAGYTVFCDWSARDLQVEEMQLKLGPAKGKDTATSLGPFLVTPEELEPHAKGHGYDLGMRAWVNGELTSEGNWSTIDWAVGDVLAYVSRGTRLRTGDVIGLGTVGNGSLGEQRVQNPDGFRGFLQVGDEVRIEVAELGAITSRVSEPLPIHRLSSGH